MNDVIYVPLNKFQDHYDWGLRAIKSVLVVAGSLKRGDPERPEDQVNIYDGRFQKLWCFVLVELIFLFVK